MKSKKTREKILDASLQLFNEKKASNVSTVQISAAMKISPGNLYYYFANKEEVIRCIWNERMTHEITQLSARPDAAENISDILDILQDCLQHYEKYNFFYSEAHTLFTNDSAMAELYSAMNKEIIKSVMEFINKWMQNGKMVELSEVKKKFLAENAISLMNASVLYFDSNEADHRDFDSFVKVHSTHIMAFWEPYFTDEVKAEMAKELSARGWEQ